MERETYLYRNVKEDKVECLTCQRRCIISEGNSGWCHTRVNKGGKLCGELLIERYGFDIVKNKIKGGKCYHCGATIPGRFLDV